MRITKRSRDEITAGEWKTGLRADGSRWLSIGNPSSGPHYQGDLCCSDADARLIIYAPKLLFAVKQALKNQYEQTAPEEDLMQLLEEVVASVGGKI